MSTDVLNQTLVGGVKATFGRGRQFLITQLTGTVNAVAKQIGSSSRQWPLNGIGAGFKFTTGEPDLYFDTLEITSAGGDVIQIAIGDDDVDFANAVTVGNTVTGKDLPASSLTDTAPLTTVTGQHAICAQNLTRRRITLFADPRNVGDTFIAIRKTGGANNIAILLPGTSAQFVGTYGLDYLAGAAAGDSVYIFEES
jgi:hypothetical protein